MLCRYINVFHGAIVLQQGWATYDPQATCSRPPCPQDEKNNVDEYYVYICWSYGCGPRQKSNSFFGRRGCPPLPNSGAIYLVHKRNYGP